MGRYKVKKVFQDARTNEIYSAGVLITLTTDRANEIVDKLGVEYLELVSQNSKETNEPIQVEKTDSSEQKQHEDDSFPKMISRGHYELSNGELFDGNKTAAVEAENALEK
ncbi:hypothetical protein [Enterococcus sp. AZ109]|uniref:hypothetical protein n=1 Tax=Enterococcus sp. AZ109 TaxID=2774634 RepID=UPI003F212C9F